MYSEGSRARLEATIQTYKNGIKNEGPHSRRGKFYRRILPKYMSYLEQMGPRRTFLPNLVYTGGRIDPNCRRVSSVDLTNKAIDASIRVSDTVTNELQTAGIGVIYHSEPSQGEVPSYVTGQLTKDGKAVFSFSREWNYWTVSGPMPIEIAEQLYNNPIGQRDVRVVGHCGCPEPSKWVEYRDGEGRIVIIDPDGSQYAKFKSFEIEDDSYRFVTDLTEVPDVSGIIPSYHIDSIDGLKLFASTLREAGLVD